MTRQKHALLILMLLHVGCIANTFAQVQVSNDDMDAEVLAVHLNSTVFVTGESLLFKVYCLNAKTNTASRVSKLAYIELVNEKQQAVAQMKIPLKDGQGSGDLFFDTTFPSGNYTIIAYTRWMRNFGTASFFRQAISVINPVALPPINKGIKNSITVSKKENEVDGPVLVSFEKIEHTTRGKILVHLESSSPTQMSLSVNVRLAERWHHSTAPSDVFLQVPDVKKPNKYELKYLPDLRGELITGTVKEKSTQSFLNGELMSLSSPSENFVFLVSRTDSTGRFYFNAPTLTSRYVFITSLTRPEGSFDISMDSPFLKDYEEFAPSSLEVDSTLLSLLGQRHLASQVQNVFWQSEKDSILLRKETPTIPVVDKRYQLDAYTRFTNMEDVFREIIPEILVEAKAGGFSLALRNLVTGERFYNPLVLIDGIPLPGADVLMNYDPLLVKSVTITARHYYLGGLETQGIISLQTFKGNAEGLNVERMSRFSYLRQIPTKLFSFPEYEGNEELKRIPDFRTQLYWNPDLKFDKQANLVFFSNDIPGTYMVEIAGITEDGKKVFVQKEFTISR
jgi:hypothetical protein